MGLISLFSSTAPLAYQMPPKSEELICEGKKIVEVDLHRTQTGQKSRILREFTTSCFRFQ
jgi:hypothetical protein